MMTTISDWLTLATVILLALTTVGCRRHGDHRISGPGSLQVNGKLLVSTQSKVNFRIEYKYVIGDDHASGDWLQLTTIAVANPQELRLELTLPAPSSITSGARCLLRISYRIPGYLPQSKVIDASGGKIDLGSHRPVLDNQDNRGDYQKLCELLQAGDEYQAVDALKDTRLAATSPFYHDYLAALAVLAARFGDWNYLSTLTTSKDSAEPDRFWPSYLAYHPQSPFSLLLFSEKESPSGPFSAREFSLAQISAASRDLTRHPALELNKYLLAPDYRQRLSAAPENYRRMYAELSVAIDRAQRYQIPQPERASDSNGINDYSAAMRSALAAFATIGARKIGDLEARKLMAARLASYVPSQFQLRQENFRVNHSYHGEVSLVNFYIEPLYSCRSRVLLASHYDSFSAEVADPGANNGLSGVLALVYLLQDRLFLGWCRKNQIGIHWHFYDGETAGEPGERNEYFLGSKYFVNNHHKRAREFRLVLCLDMIGAVLAYDHIIASTDNQLTQTTLQIARSMGARIGSELVINDDHLAYHQLQVPATLLIRYSYPYYHTAEDSIDKLNPYCLLAAAALARNTILCQMCR